jgi:DNA polymerase
VISKEFEEKIQSCKKCGLWLKRTNVVIHRGSVIPKIVFVGEAPGFEEDKQGKPFVGRAGMLLQSWINELGLLSGDYAIMNVVKCIPRTNGSVRPPTFYEIESCRKWTEEQLELYRSKKLIIALGLIASLFLLDKQGGKMGDFENRLFETRFGKVFCFPHPAYFLRRQIKADLSIIKKVIEKYV